MNAVLPVDRASILRAARRLLKLKVSGTSGKSRRTEGEEIFLIICKIEEDIDLKPSITINQKP